MTFPSSVRLTLRLPRGERGNRSSGAGRFRACDALIALFLAAAAIFAGHHLTPWMFMWATAFGLGAAAKWLAWLDARIHGARPSLVRSLGWFVAWPGLDGRAFLGDRPAAPRPQLRDGVMGVAHVFLGLWLVVGVFPALQHTHSLIAVWLGMIGFSSLWHFGLIRLMASFRPLFHF